MLVTFYLTLLCLNRKSILQTSIWYEMPISFKEILFVCWCHNEYVISRQLMGLGLNYYQYVMLWRIVITNLLNCWDFICFFGHGVLASKTSRYDMPGTRRNSLLVIFFANFDQRILNIYIYTLKRSLLQDKVIWGLIFPLYIFLCDWSFFDLSEWNHVSIYHTRFTSQVVKMLLTLRSKQNGRQVADDIYKLKIVPVYIFYFFAEIWS